MGGNISGSFSSGAFDDLEKRIAERLRALAHSANKILFACEEVDQRALQSHLTRSAIVMGEKNVLAIGPNVATYAQDIGEIQLLVTFTDATTGYDFLNGMVEAAFQSQTQCIHVRAHSASPIPSKVLAYRWRVMSWDELVDLIR